MFIEGIMLCMLATGIAVLYFDDICCICERVPEQIYDMVSRHKGQKDKHKVPWQRRQQFSDSRSALYR